MYLTIIVVCFILSHQVLIDAQKIDYNMKLLSRHSVNCVDNSGLEIVAIVVTADRQLLMFLESGFVATGTAGDNDTVYPVIRNLMKTTDLLPQFEGHVTTAFTIENSTYFLNNGTEMWKYDSDARKFSGPELRTNKFKCFKENYTIDSVLTVHTTHVSPHIMIYHSENDKHYLTFCNLQTGEAKEMFSRAEDIGATEILWHEDDNIYEGIAVSKYFFSRFRISPFQGNLNYIKLNGPLDDSQLLMGCPQNLCYNGDVDAIVTTPHGITYVFRGIYFWKFSTDNLTDTEFTVKNAKLISDGWIGLESELEAAYCEGNVIHFIKKGLIFSYDLVGENATLYPIEAYFNGLKFVDLDTVWFDRQNKEIYFIKGNQYWVYNTRTELISENGSIIMEFANDIYYSRVKINAIFEDSDGNICIVMRDYLFQTNSSSLKRKTFRNPVLLQKHLFSCQTSYNYTLTPYNSFNGFEQYMKSYKPIRITFRSNDNINTTDNSESENRAHNTSNTINTGNELLSEKEIKEWNNRIYEWTVKKDELPRWAVVFMLCTITVFFVVCVMATIVIIKQTRALRKA